MELVNEQLKQHWLTAIHEAAHLIASWNATGKRIGMAYLRGAGDQWESDSAGCAISFHGSDPVDKAVGHAAGHVAELCFADEPIPDVPSFDEVEGQEPDKRAERQEVIATGGTDDVPTDFEKIGKIADELFPSNSTNEMAVRIIGDWTENVRSAREFHCAVLSRARVAVKLCRVEILEVATELFRNGYVAQPGWENLCEQIVAAARPADEQQIAGIVIRVVPVDEVQRQRYRWKSSLHEAAHLIVHWKIGGQCEGWAALKDGDDWGAHRVDLAAIAVTPPKPDSEDVMIGIMAGQAADIELADELMPWGARAGHEPESENGDPQDIAAVKRERVTASGTHKILFDEVRLIRWAAGQQPGDAKSCQRREEAVEADAAAQVRAHRIEIVSLAAQLFADGFVSMPDFFEKEN